MGRLIDNGLVDEADRPDWYLTEWLQHFDKKQASLTNELGWDKSRANFVWHGKQPYRREIVNEVAQWLGLEPYELLMRPSEALQLRQLREAAYAIAANQTAMAAETGREFVMNPIVGREKARPAKRKAG